MAKVYYVKDGSYPRNFLDLGRRLSVEVLERRLQGQELRYLSTLPPEFHREHPSPQVKYVLVEVDMDEPRGQLLTRTGYYLLPHLSPDEAEASSFHRCNDANQAEHSTGMTSRSTRLAMSRTCTHWKAVRRAGMLGTSGRAATNPT